MSLRTIAQSLAVFGALSAIAPSAGADVPDADRATARKLAEEGKDALTRGDYAKAEDRFRRADALIHAPTLLLGVARAEAGQGKLVAASESYERILREDAPEGSPEPFFKAIADANVELAALSSRVASVEIDIAGADLTTLVVTMDGSLVSSASLGVKRLVDPGDHAVHAEAKGSSPKDIRFQVEEGQSRAVRIELARAPGMPAAPSSTLPLSSTSPSRPTNGALRPLAFAALGVGAVGLVVFGVSGGLALEDHGALASACPTGTCPGSEAREHATYKTTATVATVSLVAGGALAFAGVLTLALSPKRERSITAALGFGSMTARGTF